LSCNGTLSVHRAEKSNARCAIERTREQEPDEIWWLAFYELPPMFFFNPVLHVLVTLREIFVISVQLLLIGTRARRGTNAVIQAHTDLYFTVPYRVFTRSSKRPVLARVF